MNEHLTTAELAKAMRVSDDTVREWAKNGRIPVIRASRKTLRYNLAAVKKALADSSKAS